MLSYRHAFHAGNFADVLKHIVLVHSLNYLTQKEKPFCFIDTHAGAGLTKLNSSFALKNKEFENGIFKCWQENTMPTAVTEYLNVIKQFNAHHQLLYYPGSPLIAQNLTRENDRLICYELHSTDIALLETRFKHEKRMKTYHADGLIESLKALPPKEKRGLIFIDPSYEIKTDYDAVVDTVKYMYKRFAQGHYLLWYPIINQYRCERLQRNFKNSGIKNILIIEFSLTKNDDVLGMSGNGLIVINPVWTLFKTMQEVLPFLVNVLAPNKGFYRLEMLVSE